MDSFRSAERHDVVASYDQLAPYYDAFTAGYDYGAWTDSLEALAIEHGLTARGRASSPSLDVATA
jgi:hypothetical protein